MEKIALLPGGFKPPHAGHYNMAKWLAANTDADTVVVKVGAKEREGITRDQSLLMWELYRSTDTDPVSNKLTILPSNAPSPVRDVYDFIEQEAPEGSIIYLAIGEKDSADKRYANISKFAEPRGIQFSTVEVPPQAGGVSGTEMRGFIKNGEKDQFQKYLPEHLSQENKDKIWTMLEGSIQEDLYNPEDHVLDYMKSSEWKAGMPDGPKDDETSPVIKYQRGGKYNAATGQGGAGTMYEDHQTGEGNKKLRIYDFDDTLAITRGANIRIKHADGSTERLDPGAYAVYEPQPGDKFDFTEFDKVIKDATPIQHIVNMLRADLQDVSSKVTILTARLLAYPVRRYLKSLGLDVYVVAVGTSNPQDKADWIEKEINKGYDDITFVDDSEKNIAAVKALIPKYPDIQLKVNHPDELSEMMGGTMNNQEKAKHEKNLKKLRQVTRKQGDQMIPVPDFIKGTLTRKLHEMDDFELKYWSLYADLVKKLDTPDAEETYIRLSNELTGEKLDALEYFYHTYFKEDSPERFDEIEYGSQNLLQTYQDQIKTIDPQWYRNLQLMMSQQQDKEVDEEITNALESGKLEYIGDLPKKDITIKPSLRGTSVDESILFSQDWWSKQLKENILEAKANTHLTHLEELILTEGQDGYNKAKSFLLELIQNLKGHSNAKVNTSVKWDGAPAMFVGTHPENGKFFVGTKSVFNKEPKINYTKEDINQNHGHAPGLATKLKLALEYLPSLGITNILQGDFMFSDSTVSTKDIDGVAHYIFRPNTITYAVEADSNLGQKISTAGLGIVFHTTYDDLKGNASFGADVSSLNKSDKVWFDDAWFDDDTGTVTITPEEAEDVLGKIKEADSIKVNYDSLPSVFLNTYINSEIRTGQFLEDPSKSYDTFLSWLQEKLNKKGEKLKSDKGKEKHRIKSEEEINNITSNKENIINVLRLSKILSEAKSVFITKYNNAVYRTKHFVDDGAGGLKVTNPEGYVAVDHIGNGVKLVDRLEFSRANFAMDKGFAK